MEEEGRELPDVSPDDLGEFFKSVGAATNCPVCGSDKWKVPGNAEVLAHAIPWATAAGDMYMNGVPVFTMVCSRCYFVRMHAFSVGQLRAIVSGKGDA
jgi:hypothetical protein